MTLKFRKTAEGETQKGKFFAVYEARTTGFDDKLIAKAMAMFTEAKKDVVGISANETTVSVRVKIAKLTKVNEDDDKEGIFE